MSDDAAGWGWERPDVLLNGGWGIREWLQKSRKVVLETLSCHKPRLVPKLDVL